MTNKPSVDECGVPRFLCDPYREAAYSDAQVYRILLHDQVRDRTIIGKSLPLLRA